MKKKVYREKYGFRDKMEKIEEIVKKTEPVKPKKTKKKTGE